MGAGCALPLTPPGPPSAGVHANRTNRRPLAVESHLSLCAEKKFLNHSGLFGALFRLIIWHLNKNLFQMSLG